MQPETKFKNKLKPKLEALPKSVWFKIQQLSLRGVPDYLGCVNGHFVALELKRSAKAPISTLQKMYLGKILVRGGFARVIYPENEEEILEGLCKHCYGRDLQSILSGK